MTRRRTINKQPISVQPDLMTCIGSTARVEESSNAEPEPLASYIQLKASEPLSAIILLLIGNRYALVQGDEFSNAVTWYARSENLNPSQVIMWNQNGWKARLLNWQMNAQSVDSDPKNTLPLLGRLALWTLVPDLVARTGSPEQTLNTLTDLSSFGSPGTAWDRLIFAIRDLVSRLLQCEGFEGDFLAVIVSMIEVLRQIRQRWEESNPSRQARLSGGIDRLQYFDQALARGEMLLAKEQADGVQLLLEQADAWGRVGNCPAALLCHIEIILQARLAVQSLKQYQDVESAKRELKRILSLDEMAAEWEEPYLVLVDACSQPVARRQ